MVINCETVISNSSSHVWNERKLKWNFCRKSKSKHDTIKNKNSSFFEEKITVVKWSKNRKQSQFFFPFVYAERKFYEFFTVVHLTRVSSAMAWPLWEISTLETSRCNSISSLWKRIYWLTNAFRCLLPLVRKLRGSRFVRSRWIFAFFQSNFWILEPWTRTVVVACYRWHESLPR